MNERIRELAEQAKLQLDQDIKDGKKDWKNTPQSYDEMVQEKFAELLVRDCLNIAKNWNDQLVSAKLVKESNAVGIVAYRIARQFGVEE